MFHWGEDVKDSSKIINLREYRLKRRRTYLVQHGEQLEAFIVDYLSTHVPFDLNDITHIYLSAQQQDNALMWDTLDLREVVSSALAECLGDTIMDALRGTRWFDESFVNSDEILDRCTSLFILQQGRAANS